MPANSSLLQLSQLGLKEQRFATDVVGVLLKELSLLVAIDGANAFLEETTPTKNFELKNMAPTTVRITSISVPTAHSHHVHR